MAQPVAGYERGIPDEAIDVEQIAEVKIYDEDEWEKCLGKGGQGPDDIFLGDADVVGARQLTIFREIFDDEEKNMAGKKMLYDGSGPEVMNLAFRQKIAELLYPTGDPLNTTWPDKTLPVGYCGQGAPLLMLLGAGAGFLSPAQQTAYGAAYGAAATATALSNMSTLRALYTEKYEMSYLTRDKWYFNEDWETDEDFGDPDKADLEYDHSVDGWGPILMDPRDAYDIYRSLRTIKFVEMQQVAEFHQLCMEPWRLFFAGGPALPGGTFNPMYDVTGGTGFVDGTAETAYKNLNTTLANFGFAAAAKLAGLLVNWSAVTGSPTAPDGSIGGDAVMYLFLNLDMMLSTFYYTLDFLPFDNPLYILINLGIAGLPIGVPATDFAARLLKEFNIKDDVLYRYPFASYGEDLLTTTPASCLFGSAPTTPPESVNVVEVGKTSYFMKKDLGGETVHVYVEADVELEGDTITVEIEYKDDQIDPKDMYIFGGDNEDELKDHEILISVVEMGALGISTFTRGDTILWQKGSVDQIPGYEITILLGVSAISVLAVVYVIMKKRKR